jgi:hypothetical protein
LDVWFKLFIQGVEDLSSFTLHKGNIIVAFDVTMIQNMTGYVGRLQARWLLRAIRVEGR